eukprot:Trichotokara_eunicae@DN3836_c0_g1_i1.p1
MSKQENVISLQQINPEIPFHDKKDNKQNENKKNENKKMDVAASIISTSTTTSSKLENTEVGHQLLMNEERLILGDRECGSTSEGSSVSVHNEELSNERENDEREKKKKKKKKKSTLR